MYVNGGTIPGMGGVKENGGGGIRESIGESEFKYDIFDTL
jgi:hypothetical protein